MCKLLWAILLFFDSHFHLPHPLQSSDKERNIIKYSRQNQFLLTDSHPGFREGICACFQENYCKLWLLYIKMRRLHTTEQVWLARAAVSSFVEKYGFTLSFESIWISTTVLCEQWSSILSYFTDHTSSLWLPLPPLFSLSYHSYKKATRTFSEWKQAHVVMEPSIKVDGNGTTLLSHHPYILGHSVPTMHTTKLYMHIGLFTPTSITTHQCA